MAAKQYPRYGQMVKGYRYAATITFDPKYGHLASGHFPAECVADCSASGSVDDAVAYWTKKLNFAPPRDLTERYLKEFGAWDDLDTADEETLAHRVLWAACCDIAEQGSWGGLLH